MRNFSCFLVLLFLSSCSGSRALSGKVQGIWTPDENENAAFTIRNNSLQYFEDETKLDLQFSNDTISLFEEGHLITRWKVLKVTGDSLYIKTEDATLLNFLKIK